MTYKEQMAEKLNTLTITMAQADVLAEYLALQEWTWHDGIIQLSCECGAPWCVTFDNYEPGCPIGHGDTAQQALDSFIDTLEMRLA